jgi:uncharacterized protein (TIGR03435 family)
MMRSLLVERFHLKYHVETRIMPAYVLCRPAAVTSS